MGINKNFRKNLEIYDSSGKRRSGLFSPRENSNNYHPADRDNKNRAKVLEQIKNYLNEGKTLKEATIILASDENIKEQFKYLINIGLNLETTFEGWYTSCEKSKHKQTYLHK